MEPNTWNEKTTTSILTHLENLIIEKGCISMGCGDFNADHYSKLPQLEQSQDVWTCIDLKYTMIERYTREIMSANMHSSNFFDF